MEHPLKTLWEKPSRLVIGFMSGTSADGVDAALVRITGFGTQTRAEQLGFRFVPFSDEVRAEILRLAGKEDRLTVTVKDGTPEKYSVLDNMMLRLTGIEEPSGWRETLASYMKETGGLE